MVIGFLHNSRRLQASAETRLHQTVIGGRVCAPGKANKGCAIQVANSEPRLPGHGVPFRHGEYYVVLRYRPLIQFFAQRGHANDETRIKSARPDGFHLQKGHHGNGCQFSVWLLLPEPAKRLRNDAMPRNTFHKSHPEGTGLAARHALGAPDGLLHFL